MGRLRTLLEPMRMGRDADGLLANLRKRIVGQDAAIRQIVDIYQMYLAGMASPGRPVGSFLFLGPTGSGKTRTVEALAESLLGDPKAVIKVDCAEFQHSHEIAKLIGSPPGYLGHRETHPLLSQETLNQFHTEKVKLSFVLFDEIEKASDALWNLLLGVLDKATLTLGDNRRVDFSRSMIFMTSNLGAREMENISRPNFGLTPGMAGDQTERFGRTGTEAARKRFSPEFMNRLDKTVVFNPLGDGELKQILGLELRAVEERVSRATGANPVTFSINPAAEEFLLHEGTDPRYGARHLKRAVERLVVQPTSNLLATGQLQPGDTLVVDLDAETKGLVFMKETVPHRQASTGKSAAA